MSEDNRAAAPPPQPQTSYVRNPPTTATNGMAVASLVLGILSVLVVWIPVVGLISWVLAPLGLVFGAFGMRDPHGRGLAVAGLVCSLVGLAGCVAWLMLVGAFASTIAASATD